jgi:hypothetical protein
LRLTQLDHRFVDEIPVKLEEGVLYVSMVNQVAVHLCPSRCGLEVATPLGKGQWSLFFDGAVTLRPSVGNWSYDCESHYVITRDQVLWVERGRTGWPALPRGFGAEQRPGLLRRLLGRLRGGR